MRIPRLITAILFGIVILTGCSGEKPAVPSATTPEQDLTTTASEASASVSPVEISLIFTPVERSSQNREILHLASVHEKKRFEHDLVVYERESAGTGLFIGQIYNDGIIEYGTIGEEHYLTEITVAQTQVFGDQFVIVQGLCGANCAVNYLLHNDGAGKLVLSFVIYGGLQIVDLNGDGVNELLCHTGSSIAEADIYKKVDGQIMSVNINQAIRAANGVRYNDAENVFETSAGDEFITYRYSDQDDKLIQVLD